MSSARAQHWAFLSLCVRGFLRQESHYVALAVLKLETPASLLLSSRISLSLLLCI